MPTVVSVCQKSTEHMNCRIYLPISSSSIWLGSENHKKQRNGAYVFPSVYAEHLLAQMFSSAPTVSKLPPVSDSIKIGKWKIEPPRILSYGPKRPQWTMELHTDAEACQCGANQGWTARLWDRLECTDMGRWRGILSWRMGNIYFWAVSLFSNCEQHWVGRVILGYRALVIRYTKVQRWLVRESWSTPRSWPWTWGLIWKDLI